MVNDAEGRPGNSLPSRSPTVTLFMIRSHTNPPDFSARLPHRCNGFGGPRHRFRLATALLLATLGLSACETYSAPSVHAPLASTTPRVVSLEPCQDKTGLAISRDLAGEATAALSKALRDSAVVQLTDDAPLRLSCDVTSFVEGSAVKRWLLPGWGATKGQIKAVIWDAADDQILASFDSRSQVRSGGLYTIGADQYILDVAARDIVQQIEQWAGGR
jgi:hypothetical protein